MGRKTNSMYTVWGQPQPHHARPTNAVSQMMLRKMDSIRSMSSTPSVAKNVRPNKWNCRAGTSSRISGWPFIRMKGIATKEAISPQAVSSLAQ